MFAFILENTLSETPGSNRTLLLESSKLSIPLGSDFKEGSDFKVTSTFIGAFVLLRNTNSARHESLARTSFGSDAIVKTSCRVEKSNSCVPSNFLEFEVATAKMRYSVSESLISKGTVSVPSALGLRLDLQNKSASKFSRGGMRPPPPPGGRALSPKCRLPITLSMLVAVLTSRDRNGKSCEKMSVEELSASCSMALSMANTVRRVSGGTGFLAESESFMRSSAADLTLYEFLPVVRLM